MHSLRDITVLSARDGIPNSVQCAVCSVQCAVCSATTTGSMNYLQLCSMEVWGAGDVVGPVLRGEGP